MAKCKYCGAKVLFIGKRKGGAFGKLIPNICDATPVYVSFFSSAENAKIFITPYGTMINGEENVNGDKCYRLHNCRHQADFSLDPFNLTEKAAKDKRNKENFAKKYAKAKGLGALKADKRSYEVRQASFF